MVQPIPGTGTLRTTLITRLRDRARIDSVEYPNNSVLGVWIDEATTKHDPSINDYTIIGEQHQEAIVILAWITYCWSQASKAGQAFPISSGGNSSNKLSAVAEWIKLAKELKAEYDRICETLGVGQGGDAAPSIVVSELTRTNYENDMTVPLDVQRTPVPVTLSVLDSSTTTTTITLQWNETPITDMLRYRVYRHSSAGIKDLSTIANESNEHPGVLEAATHVTDLYGREMTTYKVTGLTTGTVYYFVVVVQDDSGRVSVSNEVTETTS